MDIRKLKKLIELVEESNIDELEIHEAEESVRIVHRRAQVAAAPSSVPVYTTAATPVHSPADSGEQAGVVPEGHLVTAPMVGTFYLASSPGAKPFVSVGERVQAGDTLCIIEAMKILNQIEADVAGTVRSVLADDAQPVEFGQPLFALDPS